MAVRIATGAAAHIGGSEGFAICCRSRHNFPRNIGRRFLPYKAMNLFPGRVLGRCRVQPEPVARSLTHRPRMRPISPPKPKPTVDLRQKLPPKNSTPDTKPSAPRQKIVFDKKKEERKKQEKTPPKGISLQVLQTQMKI
ncbi:hypothetical protein EVAR_92023_1 [Eumeta japonica]|uniref:Uncharacterized protein n=1 Tax=Eumeta variegata TaxID=151549 RepID=A0A4C1Z9I3_EUMVA|nr:hypothetical protein EVAR_92023_1 [Eumeta japonica]